MDLEHIAIILDGNRRWAKQRGMLPQLGHKEGAKVLEKLSVEASKMGLKYLTVFTFSTENWKRSKQEVSYLMKLFKVYFKRLVKNINKYDIKIVFIGTDEGLPPDIKKIKYEVIEKTKDKEGMQLNICFNYGGRDEITNATKKIAQMYKEGEIELEDINENLISDNLYTAGIPDPDLLIRTSGEQRLSNYLPWQLTYSEFIFEEKYWPDFTIEDLKEAIEEYKERDRRFGGK